MIVFEKNKAKNFTKWKKRQKMSPEQVKEELLLLENVDEDKSGLNEVVRNAKQPNEAIQTIKRYGTSRIT